MTQAPLQEDVHDILIKEDTGIGIGRVQVWGGTGGGTEEARDASAAGLVKGFCTWNRKKYLV